MSNVTKGLSIVGTGPNDLHFAPAKRPQCGFDRDRPAGYKPVMIVTVDEQRCVTLPNAAQPGDVFQLEEAGQTRFLLTRVEQPVQHVRLERKDGYLVAVTDRLITQAATRRALDEFP